jgi:hypothetical protein
MNFDKQKGNKFSFTKNIRQSDDPGLTFGLLT